MKRQQPGMWLFLLSDSLTFGALLIVYAVLRIGNPEWPRPFALSPAIISATGMTIGLLASSLTMVWAVEAAKAGDRRQTVRWLLATMLGGLVFIALHLNEWRHLETVTPIFQSVFYGITGLHMLHVTAGVIYLGILAAMKCKPADIETGGLYWHFVDIVWMFVFPLVYLAAVKV